MFGFLVSPSTVKNLQVLILIITKSNSPANGKSITYLGSSRKLRTGELPPVNLKRQAHLERHGAICLCERGIAECITARNTELVIQMDGFGQSVEKSECKESWEFLGSAFLRVGTHTLLWTLETS